MPTEAKIYGDTELFGFRLSFVSDSQDALDVALAAVSEGNRPNRAGKALRIELVRNDVNPYSEHTHAQGALLSISSGGITIIADGTTGIGQCIYSDVRAGAFAQMIETLALFLAAQAGRVPLHASAIMVDDTAIVLAGRSGAGKSSLALAAHCAGIPVFAEDTVYVQIDPNLKLWSRLRAIHVFEKDAPEEIGDMRFRNGRWKKAIPLASHIGEAERAVLCVLVRGTQASMCPLSTEDAVARLTCAPEPGYDLYDSRAVEAVRAVARRGCWQLQLSDDPQDALALLDAKFGLAQMARQTA